MYLPDIVSPGEHDDARTADIPDDVTRVCDDTTGKENNTDTVSKNTLAPDVNAVTDPRSQNNTATCSDVYPDTNNSCVNAPNCKMSMYVSEDEKNYDTPLKIYVISSEALRSKNGALIAAELLKEIAKNETDNKGECLQTEQVHVQTTCLKSCNAEISNVHFTNADTNPRPCSTPSPIEDISEPDADFPIFSGNRSIMEEYGRDLQICDIGSDVKCYIRKEEIHEYRSDGADGDRQNTDNKVCSNIVEEGEKETCVFDSCTVSVEEQISKNKGKENITEESVIVLSVNGECVKEEEKIKSQDEADMEKSVIILSVEDNIVKENEEGLKLEEKDTIKVHSAKNESFEETCSKENKKGKKMKRQKKKMKNF